MAAIESDDDEVAFGAVAAKAMARRGKGKQASVDNIPEYYPSESEGGVPGRRALDDEVDELEDDIVPRRRAPTQSSAAKPKPTRKAAATSKKATSTRGKGKSKVVESDDSAEDFGAALAAIPEVDIADSDSDIEMQVESSTIKSSAPAATAKKPQTARSRAATSTTTRRSVSVVSSQATSTRGKRTRAAIAESDSDDDDVAFKGFAAKRARR